MRWPAETYLRIPVLARALSSVPLLGGAYLSFVREAGLDIAYQAGLVTELNRTDTRAGITLTVVASCSDSSGTAAFFTLSPAGGVESEAWISAVNDGFVPRVRLEGIGKGGSIEGWVASSSTTYDEYENQFFGVARWHPYSKWWAGKAQLTITAEEGLEWQVSFPVQVQFEDTLEVISSTGHLPAIIRRST